MDHHGLSVHRGQRKSESILLSSDGAVLQTDILTVAKLA
jgi:hypothetical protein